MFLDKYKPDITRLCRENNVRTLYAFGSVLTDQFNETSDVDLLVEIAGDTALERGEKYFNVLFALQDMLHRPVDLLDYKSVRNKYLKEELDRTKMMIYAG